MPKKVESWLAMPRPTTSLQKTQFMTACTESITTSPEGDGESDDVVVQTAFPTTVEPPLTNQPFCTRAEERLYVRRRCLLCGEAGARGVSLNPFAVRYLVSVCTDCVA